MTMLNDTTPDTTPDSSNALSIDRPGHLATGDGDHRWFLNHLATVKVTAGDDGPKMTAVEFTAPRGFGPPLHVHHEEDEIMYVLEGDIRLDLGETSQMASAGSVVSLPHGVPHVFQVESEQARFLTVTSGGKAHPTFDRFVQALGVDADPANLPAPTEIDPGHVAQVCAEHGIEVIGPPPAPLG